LNDILLNKIQKIYVIYDDEFVPWMVAEALPSAKSYVKWFMDKNKKYHIESFVINVENLNQEDINILLKEYSL
jgi:hypothetical protein